MILPETNSSKSPWKMDGWNLEFYVSYWVSAYFIRAETAISFREGSLIGFHGLQGPMDQVSGCWTLAQGCVRSGRRCSIVQAPGNGKCVLRQWSLQTWKWLGSILSKNKGTPKWMVYNGKPLLKWMIWGYHYFWKPPYLTSFCCWSVGPGTPPNKKSQRFHTLQATKYVLICVYIGRLIYI